MRDVMLVAGGVVLGVLLSLGVFAVWARGMFRSFW